MKPCCADVQRPRTARRGAARSTDGRRAGDQRRPAAALALVAAVAALALQPARAATCPPILKQTQLRLQDEKPIDLCQYAGRPVLIVNTASQCGYTPQYKSLEALQKRMAPQGLVVLGFPSNDFGGQEPGSNADVAAFCQNQYDVRFPMFVKSVVKPGPRRNPLFASLAERSGQSPGWNFHKYLLAPDGQQVQSFPSAMDPQDPAIVKAIERWASTK